jgi:hypothetical protein
LPDSRCIARWEGAESDPVLRTRRLGYRLKLASDNFNDGQKYGAFARGCPPVSAAPLEADRDAFLVVPTLTVPTVWVC